jgi:hypothetical protein
VDWRERGGGMVVIIQRLKGEEMSIGDVERI